MRAKEIQHCPHPEKNSQGHSDKSHIHMLLLNPNAKRNMIVIKSETVKAFGCKTNKMLPSLFIYFLTFFNLVNNPETLTFNPQKIKDSLREQKCTQ